MVHIAFQLACNFRTTEELPEEDALRHRKHVEVFLTSVVLHFNWHVTLVQQKNSLKKMH